MINNKKWFYILKVVLAVMVGILTVTMMREKNARDFKKITVIVQNADDHRWSAFRYGLRMAAQDHQADLMIVSTGEMLTAEEELNIMRQEADNGADAFIIQPVSGDDMEKNLKKIEKKIPVMLVESTASQEKELSLLPSVQPDHYGMGRSLAEELLADYNGNLNGKTLGILTENDETQAVTERKKGFQESVKDAGATIRWNVSGSFEEYLPKVDIVIALDNDSVITAAEYAAANNLHGALLYGIGNSTEAVYYLDTGVAACLIVPDDFSMGYQSLKVTAESLGHYLHKMENRTVSYTIIRREELFYKKNQEILYTMSQ